MNILKVMLYSCQKATELAESAELVPLTITDQLRLWLHMKICAGCRTFADQSKAIDELLEKRIAPETDTTALQDLILQKTAKK